MERVLLCNIPFTNRQKCVYKCTDPSIPSTGDKVLYPICSHYGAVLTPDDNVKAVLIAKTGAGEFYEKNVGICREELAEVSNTTGAQIEVSRVIYTPFEENRKTHNDLLLNIVGSIPLGSRISVDMTYGPKDLVIVLFTAVRFAARYLDCEIENIMYGQSDFDQNGNAINTRLCEMSPLYYLESVISNVRCDDPDKAKDMLESLLRR